GAIVLDGYARAYSVDFAGSLHSAPVEPKLYGALSSASRNVSLGNGQVAMAFSIDSRHFTGAVPLRLAPRDADRARVMAASVTARVAPGAALGFAFGQSVHGIVASMQGRSDPAFFIANSGDGASAFRESDN
ncbi:hypothetical protein, partial [Enterobacter cloacae complex sp. 742-ADZ3-9B]|uniref:hypothetical protein n=1 Tax=Enterobacter cloacae complex sp. 742-ADZ3-9B TaxID=2511992 RepID=UPI0010259912